MWPCAVLLLGHFFISSVQANCLVQYEQAATGVGVPKATFNSTPYCAYYGGVIVVTFNYRLNVLGFLKTNKFNISGNFGLKDQTTLLRWVQRYIGNFGGDPAQVTLLGHSAGAGSVTHHLYIPQSKDLFHRMIVLSGSLLASWSFMYEPRLCTESYLSDLQPKTAIEFRTRAFEDFFIRNGTTGFAFGFALMGTPCFIPELEQEEFERDNYTVNAPHVSVLSPPITKLLAAGNVNSSEEALQQIADVANLRYPMRRLAQDLAQTLHGTMPVYYLRFEFDGQFGKAKYKEYISYLPDSKYGAIHGDDLGYIFSPYNLEEALAKVDQYREEWRIHRWTVELIANFIKHG
uniref:Carboxylic ester hydrolase n=1 Tax=Anopheles melas TaxID=34690 RepID=A0A182TD92_9DIPT